MIITHLKDIVDKNATYDTVITNAGIVLVAKTISPSGCTGCICNYSSTTASPPDIDVSCLDMPRCDSARTDNRAIIWVRSAEPSKFGSPELQQLILNNLTKEPMTKKPAEKTYDPQETRLQLNNLLHSVASLNQTTNSLEILARQVKRAADLINRNDAGVSLWSAFVAENHGKEVLLNTIQANMDNKKLSDAEFRKFVSNTLKD